MGSEVFRQKGHRLTAQRELILQILSECSGHVARKDIYRRVHAQLPMVNWSTVSNTLEVLEKLGVVRHVHEPDGTMRYHRAEDHLHLHLVCHDCGETVEVVETSIGDPLHHLLQERFGFTADLTHFPIAGICAACLAIASSLSQASRIA